VPFDRSQNIIRDNLKNRHQTLFFAPNNNIYAKQQLIIFTKMKLFLTALIILTTSACGGDHAKGEEKVTEGGAGEQWQLSRMSAGMAGAEKSGGDMEWQETLTLLPEKQFLRTRSSTNGETTAKGNYEILNEGEETFLVLTYLSQNSLIGNCSGDLKEHYHMVGKNTLTGTWGACDGPTLTFTKATK